MGLRDAAEPQQLADELEQISAQLEPFDARGGALVPAGSDHQRADPTLPERLEAARRLAPDLGARIASLAEHLARPPNGSVPVWRGEWRSRWIVSAQRRILDTVTGCLSEALGFSPEECRSLVRDLKSGLELTLERIL